MSAILPTELLLIIVQACIRRKTILIKKPCFGYSRLVKLVCFQRDLAQISEHVNLKLVCRMFYHKVWQTMLDKFDGRLRIVGNWYGLQKELRLQNKDKYCWLWSRVKEINVPDVIDATAIPYLELSRLPNLSKVTIDHTRTPSGPVVFLKDIPDDELISSLAPELELPDTNIAGALDSLRESGLSIVLKVRYCGKSVHAQWIGAQRCSPGVVLDITNKHKHVVIARYANIDFLNERMDVLM